MSKKIAKHQRKPARAVALNKQNQSSEVRIIAGQWRGRKLSFATNVKGLRPTPDRIRETLFNWLQGYVYKAHCLDLFAGSGALGFEALSRGAAHVTFVEKHQRVARQLETNQALLRLESEFSTVLQGDAVTVLQNLSVVSDRAYDVIFLDPPFYQGLLPEVLGLIEKHSLLAPLGWLYLEYAADETLDFFDDSCLVLHKQNKAGQVMNRLYQNILVKL